MYCKTFQYGSWGGGDHIYIYILKPSFKVGVLLEDWQAIDLQPENTVLLNNRAMAYLKQALGPRVLYGGGSRNYGYLSGGPSKAGDRCSI